MNPSRCEASCRPHSQSSWSTPSIAVGGWGRAGGSKERGEPVGDVHDVVADPAAGNLPGPAHDARGPQVALVTGEVGALPKTRCAAPQQHVLRAVVASEHDDRVPAHPELVNEVQQCPEVSVELNQAVGPVALAACALELLARDHRHVHQRMVEVDKERAVGLDCATHELRRPPQELEVAVSAHIEREQLCLGDIGLAPRDLDHPRHRVAPGVIERIGRPQRLVVGSRRPVPLGKPLVGRPTPGPSPTCHFPYTAHAYPASDKSSPIVFSHATRPHPSGAPIGTVWLPERTE